MDSALQLRGRPAGLFITLLITTVSSALPAQGAPVVVRGTVRDSAGPVLPAAQVIAFAAQDQRATRPLQAAATDPRGRFDLHLPQSGTYVIRVSLTGYCPRSVRVHASAAGKTLQVRLDQVPTRPCDLTEAGCPYNGSDPCVPAKQFGRTVPHAG